MVSRRIAGVGAAVASVLAGFVHAGAAEAHGGEGTTHVLFFAVAALAQLAWAAVVVTRPTRLRWLAGALANAAIVVVWVVTRVGGEPIGAADGLATACELIVVAGALVAARHDEPAFSLLAGRSWAPATTAVVLAVSALVAAPSVGSAIGGHGDHRDGSGHGHATAHPGDESHDPADGHAHAGHAAPGHDGGGVHHHQEGAAAHHHAAGLAAHGMHHAGDHAMAHSGGEDHGGTHGGDTHAPDHGGDHHDGHDQHPGAGEHGDEHGGESTEARRGIWYEPATDDRGSAVYVGGWSQEVTHDHGVDPACRPTAEQQAAADRLAAATRAALAKYENNPAAAARDGFVPLPIFSDRQLHMLNLRRINDPTILDPSEIESFLYAVTDRGLSVLGGMYMMPSRDAQGPQFGGCRTRWHRHTGMSGRILTGGTSDRTAEMLHVWTYPGLDPYGEYGAREVSQLWGPGAGVPSVCTDGACF